MSSFQGDQSCPTPEAHEAHDWTSLSGALWRCPGVSFLDSQRIPETVDHPAHYGGVDNPYEAIKVIEAWKLDEDFCLGNTVKYIARAGKKEDLLQDLRKARWYLDRKISNLEKATNATPGN